MNKKSCKHLSWFTDYMSWCLNANKNAIIFCCLWLTKFLLHYYFRLKYWSACQIFLCEYVSFQFILKRELLVFLAKTTFCSLSWICGTSSLSLKPKISKPVLETHLDVLLLSGISLLCGFCRLHLSFSVVLSTFLIQSRYLSSFLYITFLFVLAFDSYLYI